LRRLDGAAMKTGGASEGSNGASYGDGLYKVVERKAFNGDAAVYERLLTVLAKGEAFKEEVGRMRWQQRPQARVVGP